MSFKDLAENLGLEEDEFSELVDLFIETANDDIEKMERALENNDAISASEAAHSLKGSSGNLGFSALSLKARTIEESSRNNILAGMSGVIVEIKKDLDDIKSQLN